jgi:hypothetical protein
MNGGDDHSQPPLCIQPQGHPIAPLLVVSVTSEGYRCEHSRVRSWEGSADKHSKGKSDSVSWWPMHAPSCRGLSFGRRKHSVDEYRNTENTESHEEWRLLECYAVWLL